MEWKQDLILPEKYISDTMVTKTRYREFRQASILCPAPYEGYHFLVSEKLLFAHSGSVPGLWQLRYTDEFSFTLIYKEREDGRRYKRYVLSPAELQLLFHEDVFLHTKAYETEVCRVYKASYRAKGRGKASDPEVLYGTFSGGIFTDSFGREISPKRFEVLCDYGELTRKGFDQAMEHVRPLLLDRENIEAAILEHRVLTFSDVSNKWVDMELSAVYGDLHTVQQQLRVQYDFALAEIEAAISRVFKETRKGSL